MIEQDLKLNEEQIKNIDQEIVYLNLSNNQGQGQLMKISEGISNKFNMHQKYNEIINYLRAKINTKNEELNRIINLRTTSSIFKQFQDPNKIQQNNNSKIKEEQKLYYCKSKRKIKTTEPSKHKNLQQLVADLDNNTNFCSIIYDRKIKRQNSIKEQTSKFKQSSSWLYNQYFYANVDKLYFKQDDLLRKMLMELQFDPEKLTYQSYNSIKLSLPRPKLFNQQFILSDIDKLNEMRNKSRLISKQRSRNESEYNIGNEVIAIHPVCGHLHSGSIFAVYKENQYMIKFLKPELGTEKVMDINISLKQPNTLNRLVVENIDFQVMAITIKLLEYKSQLINQLKEYNKVAESMIKKGQIPDNQFYQQYGWIGSTINILSLGMKPILSRFRIRGIDKNNQQKIGKNFSSFLLNPFNLIYKDYQSSKQNQINTVNPIKKIIQTCKESRTQHHSKQIFTKYWSKLNLTSIPSQIADEIGTILKSFIGLLINLKLQSHNFNISQNRYLKQIVQKVDNNFPEHINQIYQTISSIAAKINQKRK